MPQGHHVVYFPLQTQPSKLHADGTDMDHWPGEPFERRMWAGGEVTFRQGWGRELQLDACPATCVESIDDVRLPAMSDNGTSDSNAKAFVDVWRRYSKVGSRMSPAIVERRTLVFFPRESQDTLKVHRPEKVVTGKHQAHGHRPAVPGFKLKKSLAPHKPDYTISLTPTRALLANFSALSYNAHSIHLDTSLAHAEGHRGLLVQGPLSLTLMLAALRGQLVSEDATTRQATKWIGYRNLAPLYCDEPLTVCLREKGRQEAINEGERRWDVWIEGKSGGMAVKGTATTNDM
jgi:hydroxyacyl-ACP dehydratase HTD2-like protein with hotdog domain